MLQEFSPLSVSDVRYWVKASKTMPRNDVETIQRFLRQRALDCGCEEGVSLLISSMTDRFVDEEREMLRARIDARIRRNEFLEKQRIEATDDQIVKAIKRTLPEFESKKDWGGIYRILVDYCQHLGFTATKTTFVKRFAKMGIYPEDDIVKNIDHTVPPTIYKNEYNGLPFSYYAIDKGVNAYWPPSYKEWETCDENSNDFIARRKIAVLFLKKLIQATEER